jgi:hypothetical protein
VSRTEVITHSPDRGRNREMNETKASQLIVTVYK